jgi:lipopolysaccharide biosynthesis regulator YciM
MDEQDFEGGERINGFVIVRDRDGGLQTLRGARCEACPTPMGQLFWRCMAAAAWSSTDPW